MYVAIFILLYVFAGQIESQAQVIAPKYSNEFLSIGVGARALAMSGVQTATVEDVTAGYWNPAGLLSLKTKYEIGLMHSEYFAGIAKYDYAGFATRLDSASVLALSGIRFGVDDIADTRFLYDANGAINYNNIRFFSAADYGFILSYARSIRSLRGLKTGANFKVIHRVVGQFANAWGFGMDAGIQYERKGWRMGAMARDVTSTFNAWSHNTALVRDVYIQTGNNIPENSVEITVPKLILGLGRKFNISKKIGLFTGMDMANTFDGKRNVLLKSKLISVDPSAGIEVHYKQIIFLRGGVGNYQRIKDFEKGQIARVRPTFGVGVKINKFSIDYALTDIGNLSEELYSNVFSLKLALN
ncbi:MAG: PorV/PorQ family protein [Cytophagaceae bacterium]|nr:PorV/PorQ family protein [Cytophagaceae bacterium]MDW8456205.1 PorV/PorQ family protein [Cytophagaceae bacterium]